MTGSGLVVIGAAAEHVLRIFQTETGEMIWSVRSGYVHTHELPNRRQAVHLVVAGGHDQLGMPRGDYGLCPPPPSDS